MIIMIMVHDINICYEDEKNITDYFSTYVLHLFCFFYDIFLGVCIIVKGKARSTKKKGVSESERCFKFQ